MKKVLIIILLSLLMLPNLVKAERYDSAVKTANTYMLNSTYKNTYDRYLTTGLGLYNDPNDNFELGGLLSNDEFKITLNNKQSEFSYLYDGFDYWTYTKKDNAVYVVSNKKDKLLEKENIVPKTRVTEYIKSNVVVEGMGTRKNPWVFVPIYQITLKANEYGKMYLKKGETCSGGTPLENLSITYEGKNKKIDVCLLASDGYKYVSNTCSGFVSVKDDILTINKVTKDLNCTLDFGKETYRIDLDQTNAETKSQPDKMYLVYTHGWYKDVTGLTNIVKLDQNPTRTGYTFGGYQTTNADGKNVQAIDSDGKIINNDETLKLFNEPGKLNIIWRANKYRVTLNSGSDVTTTGTTSVEATYDSAMNKITVPTKGGYIFNGYYTGTNGSGTKYYNADGTSARIWDITNNTTLYAYWTICPAGTYAQAGAKTCTSCPEGYTSNAGASSSSQCLKYTCSSGTLTKDSSLGYICIVNGSASTYSYQCNCYTYSYQCNCYQHCYSCSCYNYCVSTGQSCTPNCGCNNPSFCGCGYSCYSYCTGYATSCSSCCASVCSTCYAQSCSTCYATNYYCPSGWSTYSGSGSSLKCYKNATKN